MIRASEQLLHSTGNNAPVEPSRPADREPGDLDVRAGILASAAAGLLFLSVFQHVDPLLRAVVAAAVLYLAASVFYHPRHSILTSPFSPLVMFKGLVIAAFCFNALYLAATRATPPPPALAQAVAIMVMGFVLADVECLRSGYASSAIGVDRLPRYERRTAAIVFTALYAAGWAWRAFALSRGLLYGTLLATSLEVTAYSNVLALFGQISTIAYSGMLVFHRRLAPVLLLLPLEIVWKWVGSSKAGPLYVALPVLLVCNIRGILRINARTVLAGVIMVLMFLMSFVVIHEYRVESQRIILGEGYKAFSPLEAAKNVSIDNETVMEAIGGLAERLGWAHGAATVIDGMESHNVPYQYGATYARTVSWIVPRALWPAKPGVSLGSWFAQTFLGWSTETRSEAEITVWGESYLNFGVAGGVLVPALWIGLMQLVYVRSLRLGRWGLFFLASIYVYVLNSLAVNVAVTIASVGQTLILATILYLLVKTLSRPWRRNAPEGSTVTP